MFVWNVICLVSIGYKCSDFY